MFRKPQKRQPLRCSHATLTYKSGMELANEDIWRDGDLTHGYVLRADVSLQHGKVSDAMIDIGTALNMIRDYISHDCEDAKVYALRGFAHSLPPHGNGDLAHADYVKAMEILSKKYPVRVTAHPDDVRSPCELQDDIARFTIEMRSKYFRYSTLIHRAKAYSGLGKNHDAFRDLARAMELLPAQLSAYMARAELRVTDDDDGPFMSDVGEVLRLFPVNADGYIVLAERQHGVLLDSKSALDTIGRALQVEPNAWKAHFVRGEILLDTEDFDGAIGEFQKAVSLSDHTPVGHLILAELLEGAEDKPNAIIEYKKFIQEADKADVLGIIDVIQHLEDDLGEKVGPEVASVDDVEVNQD